MKIYTIKDIAQISGVSVTTVSRVLNERPDVNQKTRKKVLAVIEECQFVRNLNAKSLKQTDRINVAVVIRGRSNPFLAEIAQAILSAGLETQASFLLEYIDEKDDEFLAARRMHTEKRIGAFIMVGARLDERVAAVKLLDLPFVFVTLDARQLRWPHASSVSIDDFGMGRRVAEYLLDQGHRRVAVFGAQREGGDSLALRYQGFCEGFKARGLVFDESRYIESRFSMAGGYETAKRFFIAKPDTTAVFAMSDPMAVGVIRALADMGKAVPKDVSVFGFDGVELGRYTIPSLTTVRQPVKALGRASVDALVRLIDGQQSEHVFLDADLIEGESIAAPRA